MDYLSDFRIGSLDFFCKKGSSSSNQFLAYHNVLRKTVRYWKTLFYHMIDIAAVNAFINPHTHARGGLL